MDPSGRNCCGLLSCHRVDFTSPGFGTWWSQPFPTRRDPQTAPLVQLWNSPRRQVNRHHGPRLLLVEARQRPGREARASQPKTSLHHFTLLKNMTSDDFSAESEKLEEAASAPIFLRSPVGRGGRFDERPQTRLFAHMDSTALPDTPVRNVRGSPAGSVFGGRQRVWTIRSLASVSS